MNAFTVLKVFPTSSTESETNSTMKLTKKKIEWIIRQKKANESSGVIAKVQHITWKRVDQLWKQYRDTGTIPVIGMQMGRPKKPITKSTPRPVPDMVSCHRIRRWTEIRSGRSLALDGILEKSTASGTRIRVFVAGTLPDHQYYRYNGIVRGGDALWRDDRPRR